MLKLEFNAPSMSSCSCCGGTTTRLTRYVYRDGDAFAIYYAAFSDNHEPRVVRTIISIGSWGGSDVDDVPSDRVAFAMDIYSRPENFEVSVIDGSASLWADVELLGRKLDREQALAHPWIKDAFHVTDHMVTEDEPLKTFLASDPATASGDRSH